MGVATIAVVAIWYLVDQKFQDPSASSASQSNQTEIPRDFPPDLAGLTNEPLNPNPKQAVPPPTQPLPSDLSKSKLTLQQPDSKVPLTLPGASDLGKQSIPKTGLPPVVVMPQSPTIIPPSSAVRPTLPTTSKNPTVNSPAFSDRPGSLLPNLPDPMERYNSGSSAYAPKSKSPQVEPKPIAKESPKAPSTTAAPAPNTDAADTGDDLDQLPSQMPELFTSGQEKN